MISSLKTGLCWKVQRDQSAKNLFYHSLKPFTILISTTSHGKEFQDLNTVKYFPCLHHLPNYFLCCISFLVQWEIAFISDLTKHPHLSFPYHSITSLPSQKVVIGCHFPDSHFIPCNTLMALLCITSSSVSPGSGCSTAEVEAPCSPGTQGWSSSLSFSIAFLVACKLLFARSLVPWTGHPVGAETHFLVWFLWKGMWSLLSKTMPWCKQRCGNGITGDSLQKHVPDPN